ncbi:MAG: hypothetical protein NTW39_06040 [Actinobacteria bacterium]|nr:hypothetical protein [Actinomycetota bacterium]
MKLKPVAILVALLLTTPLTTADAVTAMQWNSQTKISGVVTIPVGTIVTVAPGTKITVGAGAKIIVLGQLLAPKGLTLTGSNWKGLVVSGSAVLTDFVEKGALQPFYVTAGGSLDINGGNISGINGASLVDGTFTAKNLHYVKGSGDGITSTKASGSISVDAGKFSGPGRGVGDFFSLSAGELLKVTNSSITKVHCAFHITGLKNMQLDGVNIENNAYGFMMYGSSDAGARTITNTTITNNDFGFDEGASSIKNGAITISNSYIKNNKKDLGLFTNKVTISSPSSKPLQASPKS